MRAAPFGSLDCIVTKLLRNQRYGFAMMLPRILIFYSENVTIDRLRHPEMDRILTKYR